jgi:hypothetical protein
MPMPKQAFSSVNPTQRQRMIGDAYYKLEESRFFLGRLGELD